MSGQGHGELIRFDQVTEGDRLRIIYSILRYDSGDQDRIGEVVDVDHRTKFHFATTNTEGDVVLTFHRTGNITTTDGRKLGTTKRIFRLPDEQDQDQAQAQAQAQDREND